jgi:hypothetical protein
VAVGCGDAGNGGSSALLVAAGDIGNCDSQADESTARLLPRDEGVIAALGDNAYENGTPDDYRHCYAGSWGPYRDRTRPTPGNHDYDSSSSAKGYFDYFGRLAGDRETGGYYSYDLGAWHIVVLNSECEHAGGCGAGSRQERWLRADLKASSRLCTLAYWHRPRFSSGQKHGGTDDVDALWEALADFGAEVVLSGHEHNYERFLPQDAGGARDPRGGITEFVVGTGGAPLYPFKNTPARNSEVRRSDAHGVLRLSLGRSDYSWAFVSTARKELDAGRARCHD